MELGYNSYGYDVLKNIAINEELIDNIKNNHFDVTFYNTYMDEKNDSFQNSSFAFGVVGVKSKEMVFDYYKQFAVNGTQDPNLIHPFCVISKSVELNKGIQIESLCSISGLTKIGFSANIKRNSAIGHHCAINNYVTNNPRVTISSFVEIGKNSQIDSGIIITE